jgi:host factor-I protein
VAQSRARLSHIARKFGLRVIGFVPLMAAVCAGKRPFEPVRTEKVRRKAISPQQQGQTAMAAERTQNLQDTFLNYVRKNKTPLTIFLVNGVKLQGVVTWFDNFCVLLRRDGHSQLVYKHAISTVMPGHPVQLYEPADEAVGTGAT